MPRSKKQKHLWVALILALFGIGLALNGAGRFTPFFTGPKIVPDFIVFRLLNILIRYHVSFLAVLYGISCLLSAVLVLCRRKTGYRLLRINLVLWILAGFIGAFSVWWSGHGTFADVAVPLILVHVLPAALILVISG